MADSAENLHGNVPDKAETVLLLIDVINDLEFPEGTAAAASSPCQMARADRGPQAAGSRRRGFRPST